MSSTRRAILAGALPAVGLALAGCAESAVPDESGGNGGTDKDPTYHTTRNLDDGPVLVDAGDEDGGAAGTGVGRTLITDRTTAEAVAFGDGVPDDDIESTRAFLEATDFDEETVYVTERRIESCERYRLDAVRWEPGRMYFEYCTGLRPPDERCQADTMERVGLFVRVPAALERSITSEGASGGPCQISGTDWETIGERNATDGGANGGSNG